MRQAEIDRKREKDSPSEKGRDRKMREKDRQSEKGRDRKIERETE